jgi:hypothetical protein
MVSPFLWEVNFVNMFSCFVFTVSHTVKIACQIPMWITVAQNPMTGKLENSLPRLFYSAGATVVQIGNLTDSGFPHGFFLQCRIY